jgi:hypothetical protein
MGLRRGKNAAAIFSSLSFFPAFQQTSFAQCCAGLRERHNFQ